MPEPATPSPTRKSSSKSSRADATPKAGRKAATRPKSTSKSSASRAKSTPRAGEAGGRATPSSSGGNLAGAAKRARGPLIGAAAAAAVGGALLSRKRVSQPGRRFAFPPTKLTLDDLARGLDAKPLGKRISEAGEFLIKTSERVSKLSADAERAGRTAKRFGDSLS